MREAWREDIVTDRPDDARAAVIALHGFTRSAGALQRLADALVGERLAVIRPTLASLWWPRSMNRRVIIEQLAAAVRPLLDDRPVAIVGHSAGAAAGARLAGQLIAAGLPMRGVVFVDGVENPTRHIAAAWPTISECAVRAVAAPPNPCNRHGALTTWLTDRLVGEFGIEIAGSTHGDIEGEEHRIYRLACGASADAATRARVLDHVVWHTLGNLALPSVGGRTTPARRLADRILVGNAEG